MEKSFNYAELGIDMNLIWIEEMTWCIEHAAIETNKKPLYTYFISKNKEDKFELIFTQYHDAKEVPKPIVIHKTLDAAEDCAEKHYLQYVQENI